MKKIYILFLLPFLIFDFHSSFAQITFQKVIGVPQGSAANAVQQTTDGGYIIAGAAVDPSFSFFDAYLVKTNSDGDTLWTKTFAGANDNEVFSVQQTFDGGYIVAGTALDSNQNILIIKTNAVGDTLWTKAYGGINVNYAYSIQQTTDSGYIIAGITNGFGAGAYDVYLIKVNAAGAIAWTKTYGGSANDIARCVKQTADNGYIICGHTSSFGAGIDNVYLIKTDVNGDTLWTKTYGGIGDDEANAVQQTTDGGYIIAGYSTSFGAGGEDVYLIKANATGDTLWTKTYGGLSDDWANDVQQTTDDGYIIGGATASFGAGAENVYLIKTNPNGDTLWTKTYGGTNEDIAFSVRQTTDSGYIVAGFTSSFILPQNNDGLYLIKTDANGNSGCNQGTTATIVGSTASQVASTQSIISFGGTANATATTVGSAGNDSILCFSILIKPVCNFLSSDSVLCANSCVHFTNLSSNATSYQWFFAGATDSISTAQNPQNVCYPAAGTYNVTLIASNAGVSDTLTLANYITVYPPPPTPVITQSGDTLFCSTNPSYTSYQWYLDSTIINGATDTLLVLTKSGNYNIAVKNNNGCIIAVGINNFPYGLNSSSDQHMISLSPNPATDELLITGNWFRETQKNASLRIFNVLGQEASPPAPLPRRGGSAVIDVGGLPAGIFIVQVITDGGSWVGKFVKY